MRMMKADRLVRVEAVAKGVSGVVSVLAATEPGWWVGASSLVGSSMVGPWLGCLKKELIIG